MRILLLLLPIFLSQTALAQESAPTADQAEKSQICLIDGTATPDGKQYQSCEADPKNDALLDKGFRGARLLALTQKSTQPIWVYKVCKYLDSNSAAADYFIPFGSAEEWSKGKEGILNNMPDLLTATDCCKPRPLSTADIVTPGQPCTGGWLLQGMMAANLFTPLMSVNADGTFTGADGKQVMLPVQRDDINALFNYNGATEFAARFACSGGTPPVKGIAIEDHPEKDITIIGTPTLATPGEVGHVPIRVKCSNKGWSVITVRPCTESESTRTESCAAHGFPPNTQGEVTVRVRFTCPDGGRVEEIIGQTCKK